MILTDVSTTPNSTKTATLGSVSTLANKGYTSYVAKFTQSSTNTPVISTVVVNDTGLTFAFDAYSAIGTYTLKPIENFTDATKVCATVTAWAKEAAAARLISVKEVVSNAVVIQNIELATRTPANTVDNGVIEIRIYS